MRSSDGSYLYFAYDVAYLRHKLERVDRAVYVLGADHHGYVNRLKAAAAMMGYDPDRVEVLIYQLVHLTSGGEATKVSKRRGDVVFLDDLIDEIGVDAARWYLVSRGHDQTIEIDVDLAAEKTQKNPVYYVQYAHARIAGILRNAGERAPNRRGRLSPARSQPEERGLVKRLLELPGARRRGGRAPRSRTRFRTTRSASRTTSTASTTTTRCWAPRQEAFRLALCEATRAVVARSLDLIGVAAPDAM